MKKEMGFLQKLILILKSSAGSAIAWKTAELFGSNYPYLAPISLILCLQATILKSVQFALARIIGTITGVLLTLAVASHLHVHYGWTIFAVMLLSTGIPLFFQANITTLHQIALSAILILAFQHKLQGYGMDRIRDTFIGVVIALLMHAFFFPPNYTKTAHQFLQTFSDELAAKLKGLSVWLEDQSQSNDFFESEMGGVIRKDLEKSARLIKKAEDSLRFNPFSKKSKGQMQGLKHDYIILRKTYAHIENIHSFLREWNQIDKMTQEDKKIWSYNLRILLAALTEWKSSEFHSKHNYSHQLKRTSEAQNDYSPALYAQSLLFLQNISSGTALRKRGQTPFVL